MNYHYLSIEDRKEIEQRYARGDRPEDIAAFVGVHTATIYRELERGYTGKTDENGKPEYSAIIGESKQKNSFRRRWRAIQKEAGEGEQAG